MNLIWRAVVEYGRKHSIEETDIVARKLLGLDAAKEDAGWRTTENGKHYHINGEGEVDKGPKVMVGANVSKPSTWKKPKAQVKRFSPKQRPKDTDELFKVAVGSESYMLTPEYKDALDKWRKAYKKNSELSKRHAELDRQLDKELIPVPGLGIQYAELFDSYTEKGKKIKEEKDRVWEEFKESEKEYSEASKVHDRIKMREARKQASEWQDKPLVPASESDYPGFSMKTGIADIDEMVESGKAHIVEMSPKEYLQRCAFEIFGNTTYDNQVSAVNLENAEDYADKMESGKKFDMPYLNFSSSNQEGRHRAIAAMLNGYEKIPVAVIGTPQKKLPDYDPDEELPDDLLLEETTLNEPEDVYDPDAPAEEIDIWELLTSMEEETEEEKAEHERKRAEEEREERERNDYGQNGLNEKDYPEELRLTEKERDEIFDVYRGYKDYSHKVKASADVMNALSGMTTPEYLEEREKQYTEILEAATEMIAQRKNEGYSFKNTAFGQMSSLKRKQAWWDYFNENGEPPPALGKNGIQYWQRARKDALRKLSDISLAKKIAKRYEFAEKQPGFLPWRKNDNSTNQWYRPWERAKDAAPVTDEEIWRTNEEGNHFKFESTTGEIKAGFGGKYNGQKLGQSWKKSEPAKPKKSGSSNLTESQQQKVTELRQRVQGAEDIKVGRAYGRYNGDVVKAQKFLKEYESYSDAKKQEYAGVCRSYQEELPEAQAKADACREELKKRGLWDEEGQDVKAFPTCTPQQDKSLKRIAKRIANLKKEQSFIVGPDGEIRAHANGEKGMVSMTVGTNREHMPGAISLHNHPAGGTFSYDDLDDFGYGATELRVSTPEGTYYLRDNRYGRGDQNGGWVGLRDRLKDEVMSKDLSVMDLMKQADKNLAGNETRQKLQEIAETWVKMKDAGASNEVLQSYFDESGYDDLRKKASEERKAEIRRLEVAPFDDFYREHAAEYGFDYEFVPTGKKNVA